MKMTAVILAAGQASRMGKTKQLLPWGKGTLLGSTIDLYTNVGLDEVIVVVGHCAAEIRAALKDKPVHWVVNEEYAQGMATSLKSGISALGPEVEAVYLALGDTPLTKPETLRIMAEEYGANKSKSKIIIPCHGGRQGHPVLFAKELFPEMLTVTGDVGAREIIRKHQDLVMRLPVADPGIALDVDTWQDYETLLAKEI